MSLALTTRPMRHPGDSAFCRNILKQHNVAAAPGSCFGLAPCFRISYAASEANLVEVTGRITITARMPS
jgi:aspartate aminotransferase